MPWASSVRIEHEWMARHRNSSTGRRPRTSSVVNHNVLDGQYAVAGTTTRSACAGPQAARDGSAWVQIPASMSPSTARWWPACRLSVTCLKIAYPLTLTSNDWQVDMYQTWLQDLRTRFYRRHDCATGFEGLNRFGTVAHGQEILIELLAWQFASPVRWMKLHHTNR